MWGEDGTTARALLIGWMLMNESSFSQGERVLLVFVAGLDSARRRRVFNHVDI
jgi:hypothetical protein